MSNSPYPFADPCSPKLAAFKKNALKDTASPDHKPETPFNLRRKRNLIRFSELK